MAVKIPTLRELSENLINSIQTQLGVIFNAVGRVFLRGLSNALAGELYIFYLALARVQKNIFPDTAEDSELERFGIIKLGRGRFPAVQARYSVTFTGDPGAVVPAQTIFRSNDNSQSPRKVFQLDAPVTIPGSGTITADVRALEGGTDSALSIGDVLTSTSPLINVQDEVVVDSETVAPQDRETTEAYREAIIDSYRLEPQGGAGADYRLWSADASGARRVYPYNQEVVVNGVIVYVEATEADSTDGKGTPTPQIITNVEDAIEFDPDTTLPVDERGRRPTQVRLTVAPITPKDVDITITNAPDFTTAEKTLIEEQMRLFLSNIRPFITGVDITSERNDLLTINGIISVIISVVGNNKTFDSVGLVVDGNIIPIQIFFEDGDIPAFNSITYV